MARDKLKKSNAIFRAIADPTRREILRMLLERRHTVGEIAANFRTSRPGISRHLRVLRTVGLVTTHNGGGARILCDLNVEPLRVVYAWVREYAPVWGHRMRTPDLISRRTTKEKEKKSTNPTRANPRGARIRNAAVGIKGKRRSS